MPREPSVQMESYTCQVDPEIIAYLSVLPTYGVQCYGEEIALVGVYTYITERVIK